LDSYFSDPDDGDSITDITLTAEDIAALSAANVSWDASTHILSGTTSQTFTETTTITVTDGELSPTFTLNLESVVAPDLTYALTGAALSNVDPIESIRITSSREIEWKDGVHTFTISNEADGNGKTGFGGEAVDNDQTIEITVTGGTAAVTAINGDSGVTTGANVSLNAAGTVITIDPLWDLDFANNYKVSFAEGVFVDKVNGENASAVDINFSTVSVGDTVTTDNLSKYVAEDGSIADGFIFVNGNQGNNGPTASLTTLDVGSASVALVLGFDSTFLTPDAYVLLANYDLANDVLYLDNLGNNTLSSIPSGFDPSMTFDENQNDYLAKDFDSTGPNGSQSRVVFGGLTDASNYWLISDMTSVNPDTFVVG